MVVMDKCFIDDITIMHVKIYIYIYNYGLVVWIGVDQNKPVILVLLYIVRFKLRQLQG